MTLLKEQGITVPNFKVASTADDVYEIAKEFGESMHLVNLPYTVPDWTNPPIGSAESC